MGCLKILKFGILTAYILTVILKAYKIQYKLQKFDPDEVLHFVLIPDDLLPFKGQGFIPIVKDTIANIVQANTTKTGFLQSKWRP